jgi:alpha-L-arabinofuranosidase
MYPDSGRRSRFALTVAMIALAMAIVGAQPAGFTSAITVDFNAVTRVIPPFLFGQNLQSVARGDGILTTSGSFNQTFVDLLTEAKITTLRFPGGTAADYFHWWQALGPHSGRPKQASGNVAEFYTPVVGPEEFIKLSTALRAVPFITANFGTGGPEEAAAWAKYFTSRGFPVTYWEVGNEVYFEGILDNGLVGTPPDVYARRVIGYAAAIRKEAPYAKIFAAGVIGPEDPDSFWNSVVLGFAGAYIDGVSVHNAYYPLYGFTPAGTVPSDSYLFTAMMGATQAVDRTLSVLEGQLKRLGRLIPIFVTEYDGIFYPDKAIEDPVRTHQRNPTLGSALYNASVLQIMMRHRQVYGAHHMALADVHYGGLIGVGGGVPFRNPQFYVHREYAKEAGNLLVDLTLEPRNARFDSQPIRLLSGQTGVAMLDAVATRDAAGENYSLFVVNRSLSSTVTTTLSVNAPPAATATVSTLNGPGFLSTNTAQAPSFPRTH